MQRLERERAALGHVGLERHVALADDVEGVRRLALAKQVVAGLEDAVRRAAGDQRQPLGGHPLEGRHLGQQRSIVRIVLAPASPRSVARIAAASSVMSIATGHQVMQRPQPTQPEVPNWSIQLASLWVIHWR